MPTADINLTFNPLSTSAETTFITNVLGLLKDDKHFPYIGTRDIGVAVDLIKESSKTPLPEGFNSVLIWDELCSIISNQEGHAA